MGAGIEGNVGLLLKMMSASTERARVSADYVANESTPGFRRRVLHFEDLLRDALHTGRTDVESIAPRIEEDRLTPARPDGNNVTLELELNADRQNRLLYETYAAVLQSHFDLLKTSIESGR
jgi:flagellar basal-body rod protein FlgB